MGAWVFWTHAGHLTFTPKIPSILFSEWVVQFCHKDFLPRKQSRANVESPVHWKRRLVILTSPLMFSVLALCRGTR